MHRLLPLRLLHSFGTYSQMVRMFSEVEQMAGNKNKLAIIREFKDTLAEDERQEFDSLMAWYSRKEPIRITSKVISKYYLTKYASAVDHAAIEPQLVEGGVMRMLSKVDQDSQLSLLDLNVFLRFLCSLQGSGVQTIKAQRISTFGERVTALEGIFFLKLIEKRLTIGASNKTFRKADQKEELNEDSESDPQKTIKKTRKSKKNKDKESVEPTSDASSQSPADASIESPADASIESPPQ